MASLNSNSWTTGLWGCCDDAGSCCLTLFCPCVAFGRIAEIVDQGATSKAHTHQNKQEQAIARTPTSSTKACCASGTLYLALASLTGMGCLYSCCYRSRLRGHYGLKEKPCGDCCVHWFCEPCALCQEYRELKHRGFDMSIGWHANMEKMGKGAPTVAPHINPGMTR
ncbi:hypothetical protein ACQ4PT_060587 [Festuca glaucescens]